MTPTPMPRDWAKVDGALAGVIAFADIDAVIDRATAAFPTDTEGARQLSADAPPLRFQAERRQTQARELRGLAATALRIAAEARADARDERRRLRWQVFGLRVRVTWLRVSTAVGGATWWTLMALPRLFKWIGRVVSSPFRSSAPKRFEGDDDFDDPPRAGGSADGDR